MSSSIKFLMLVFAVLFTALSILWILGSKKSRCSTSLLIAAPPASVFPYLHEEDLCKQWIPELVDITPMGDNERVVGGRNRVTIELASGKTTEYDNEIIRFEENEYFSVRDFDGMTSKTSIFKLEPKDDKTYLTYRVRTANLGIGKLFGVFKSKLSQQDVEQDAMRLKSLIESQYIPSEAPASTPPSSESETPEQAAAAGGM